MSPVFPPQSFPANKQIMTINNFEITIEIIQCQTHKWSLKSNAGLAAK
jgi:hypothetical protein